MDSRRGFLKKAGLSIAALVGAGTAKNTTASSEPSTPPDQPASFAQDFAESLVKIRGERIQKIVNRQDRHLVEFYAELREKRRKAGHAYLGESDALPIDPEVQHGIRKEQETRQRKSL